MVLRAFVIGASATWVGLLGASAFNPDDGYLLRSEALWTVFGLAASFGMFMLYGVPIYATIRLVTRLRRRACSRGVTSTA